MKDIIQKARNLVSPSLQAKKTKKNLAQRAIKLVEEQAKRYDLITKVEFGGSYAKGTWLARDADVDIFVKFKEMAGKEEFAKISREIGFEAMNEYGPYVRYSDHPYVEAVIQNTRINVVPCYDVRPGEWKSAADRSPYHTKKMQAELTQKMQSEVRVLKTFLKSAGVYGAEIARQGFSGYVSEVMILNFKSFEGVIKAMTQLEKGAIIGQAGKKFDTSLVIIDPIDEMRNLAAAISEENIGRFILRCTSFAKRPSMKFFKSSRPEARLDLENVLVVRFNFSPRGSEIIWGQLKKATVSLSAQLDTAGFNVLRSMPHTDEKKDACLLFLLESIKIPDKHVRYGPDYFRRNDAREFVGKNAQNSQMMWLGRDGRILSLEEREFSDARAFLKNLLGNNRAGIPKGLQDDFKRGFGVFSGARISNESVKEAARNLVSTDDTFLHFN